LKYLQRIIVPDVDLENIVLFLDIKEMKLEQTESGQVQEIFRNESIKRDQVRSVDYSSIAAD
tara:strand:- start:321 stop:506 length:186 start_codon:yes stop_codon:yes gene_type:complete